MGWSEMAGDNLISRQFQSGWAAEVVPVIGKDYYKVLNWLIKNTKNTFDFTVFTSSINTGNRYHKINKLLLNLGYINKKNDVKIRTVLFRGSKNNKIGKKNERFAQKAIENNLKVRFCAPGTFLHSKVMISDNRYVLMGSHNFSSSSMSKHYETSILVESSHFADVFNKYFNNLWQQSTKY